MTFFDTNLASYPSNTKFFFNILVIYCIIPNTQILPDSIINYWNLEHVTDACPYVIYIEQINNNKIPSIIDYYPHSVIGITPTQEVIWCEDLIDYYTENDWKIEPILEDLQGDDDDI